MNEFLSYVYCKLYLQTIQDCQQNLCTHAFSHMFADSALILLQVN